MRSARAPEWHWQLPADFAELLGPDLGARPACVGHAPLHDSEIDGEQPAVRAERLGRAAAVCATCPARQPCADAAADLGAAASGVVWAGRIRSKTAGRWHDLTGTNNDD